MLNKKCALIKEQFIAPPIGTAPYLELHGYDCQPRSQRILSSDGEKLEELAAA